MYQAQADLKELLGLKARKATWDLKATLDQLDLLVQQALLVLVVLLAHRDQRVQQGHLAHRVMLVQQAPLVLAVQQGF